MALTRLEMEARRLEAAELLANGVKPPVVMRRYGISRSTISRWNHMRLRGAEAMKLKKAPGRPPGLTREQKVTLQRILELGTWTTAEFARLIKEGFGVEYTADHAGRIMHKLGWEGRGKRRRDTEIEAVEVNVA